MPVDYKKIKIEDRPRDSETDPIKIFEKLTLRGPVEKLRDSQARALRGWNGVRNRSDVAIEMSTGAGKTLVGLLIGQSLINELSRRVIFVCPTRQLVDQAKSRAVECGITTSSYGGQAWEGEADYRDGRRLCLTNYAAVFNGKSIFADHDVGALIFDDAHAAEPVLRDCFTLKIDRNHSLFDSLCDLVREDFTATSQSFEDAIAGDSSKTLFLPMFSALAKADRVRGHLLNAGVDTDQNTKFAWEHLKDQIEASMVCLSGRGIEFAPPVLPVHKLPYFADTVRRIFLSATSPSKVSFVRAFGAVPEPVSPGDQSREAERLFVYPVGNNDAEQREETTRLIAPRKSCIIVPNNRSATQWPETTILSSDKASLSIDQFAASKGEDKLLLVSRYDGIDLPGEACRVLVMDGLPRGESLVDRFIDETLKVVSLRAVRTAVRFNQAVGRIFRSETDHGVVILCGVGLRSWLQSNLNRSYLPSRLQRQLELANRLREKVEAGELQYTELISDSLTEDPGWREFYSGHLEAVEDQPPSEPASYMFELAKKERRAYESLWDADFKKAIELYEECANDARPHDRGLSAWYTHWKATAHARLGEQKKATDAFMQAATLANTLGWPPQHERNDETLVDVSEPMPQADAVVAMVNTLSPTAISKAFDSIAGDLKYGSATSKAEEALKRMGELLGLDACRPDNARTGPDVVWKFSSGDQAVSFELKTNKGTGTSYRKEDIGQYHDHIEFLKTDTEFRRYTFRHLIVGKIRPVAQQANPPKDLRIVELEQFSDVLRRLRQLYDRLRALGDAETKATAKYWIDKLGLEWPFCVDALQYELAIDLRDTRFESHGSAQSGPTGSAVVPRTSPR